jgi:hypothetical protein
MRKFSSYRSIDNFKNFLIKFGKSFRYEGKDEEGNDVYNDEKLPKVYMDYSEKIHGTNGAVGYDVATGEMWFQSRNKILDGVNNDNEGFARWALTRKDQFQYIFNDILNTNDPIKPDKLYLYGEWAGGGIQGKNSACYKHDKIFILFDIKYAYDNELIANKYCDVIPWDEMYENQGIYNIHELELTDGYLIVDLNNPDEFVKTMEDKIKKLEDNSYFAERMLGIEGNVGEGFVCRFIIEGMEYIFKMKGEKHCKKIARKPKIALSTEEEEKRRALAIEVCPDWRLEQIYKEVMSDGFNNKLIGELIKQTIQDVIKEEMSNIINQDYELKHIQRYIVDLTKEYAFLMRDEELGLKNGM